MIVYKTRDSGECYSVYWEEADYVLSGDEKKGGDGFDIPEKDTLHEQKYIDYLASIEYIDNRRLEYPTIEELTIALYDTDDKAALETKRAAVKKKWPKDNSGPVE